MDKIITELLKTVREMRRPIQLGAFLMLAIVFLVLNSKSFHLIPSILVIATVPIIVIGIYVVTNVAFSEKYAFALLSMVICGSFLMILFAFYVVSAGGANNVDLNINKIQKFNNITEIERDYSKEVRPKIVDLQQLLITPLVDNIKTVLNKTEYRFIIVNRFDKLENEQQEISFRIGEICRFFDRIYYCIEKSACTKDDIKNLFGREIRAFWNSFWPVIKKLRKSGFGAGLCAKTESWTNK